MATTTRSRALLARLVALPDPTGGTASALALGTAAASLLALSAAGAAAQGARITEETRVLTTYPFSEPDPVPFLTRDERLYPYHSFEGYAAEGVPREWKVVRMENDLIEVFVLPEVGGKVWGAVVKANGHEFIYRNEVMKFRNIALRGPWTSGGIELNFGVIGHAPSTATPVDYVLARNPDGSVSCWVGAMDLPSRTRWRVEIRLPPDAAYFETRAIWSNPTPLEQPYYNWMTGAAFARPDLEMSIPGDAYLEHSGAVRPWPVDGAGRHLPRYAENAFGGHKSYHVVGQLEDFFGGYYHEDGYGFGHWARYEEMPGQKLWLWALSREGGVWEDLLTDTDGQYVEFQAGRLLVQYAPGSDRNPITQAGFEPGAADRWTEIWFPVEGIGGLTDASPGGAMHVRPEGDSLVVAVHAFRDAEDTLRVSWEGEAVAAVPLTLPALAPVERVVRLPAPATDGDYRVRLPALGLDWTSDPSGRTLSRPFETDPEARAGTPPADRLAFEARELARARRFGAARERYEAALAEAPWHRDALVGLADLEYRRARYEAGLALVRRALQLDAYDPGANLVAGNLYRAAGASGAYARASAARDGYAHAADARDAYGWAARSMKYRSVARVQLAEMALARGDADEASRLARSALDHDRFSLPARQILAMLARASGGAREAAALLEELLALDPLHPFVSAERFLADPGPAAADALVGTLRGEYPDQVLLELAVDYVRRGDPDAARAVLAVGERVRRAPLPRAGETAPPNPLLRAWRAWLDGDPAPLAGGADPAFVFPYRPETLPVLEWAAAHDDHWSWAYLLGLELWALDRADEAAERLAALGDRPDYAPAYVARAHLLERARGTDPEADLRRAVEVDDGDRILRVELIRYLQRQGRWSDALAETEAGRLTFPGDFDLDLMQARSLVHLDRPLEAVEILDATRVLPSENARQSHALYEQAHVLAALDALEATGPAPAAAPARARDHLRAALEWPEHLGQGRPYEPEERVVRYLLGLAERAGGDDGAAREALRAVVGATDPSGAFRNRLDLLAVPALALLGRADALGAMATDHETASGRFAAALIAGIARGEDPAEVARRLAPEHPELFDDLEGRILLRALEITP
ncbi:MAG: DUF5107 domain-containing protein [Gemmatimonadota bacterium]|jgi:hypothetical protein